MQKNSTNRSIWIACLVSVIVLIGTACRTTPKIDWDSRVQNFCFDQAVLELGPPDRTAKLSDGSTVAEWITNRGTGSGVAFGVGSFGRHTGMSVGQTVNTGTRGRVLRLVFGTDHMLSSWLRR